MKNPTPLQKQLAFVASRRSMAEMEQILDRFLKAEWQHLDDDQCRRLLQLLACPDADLLEWLSGITPPPRDDNHMGATG